MRLRVIGTALHDGFADVAAMLSGLLLPLVFQYFDCPIAFCID